MRVCHHRQQQPSLHTCGGELETERKIALHLGNDMKPMINLKSKSTSLYSRTNKHARRNEGADNERRTPP